MRILDEVKRIKNMFSRKEEINIACGITPNGDLHAGSLREPFICQFLCNALRTDEKIKVNLLCNVDDCDPVTSGNARNLEAEVGTPLFVLESTGERISRIISMMRDYSVHLRVIRTSSLYKLPETFEIVHEILSNSQEFSDSEEESLFFPLDSFGSLKTRVLSYDSDTKCITFLNSRGEEEKSKLEIGKFSGKLRYRLEWFIKWKLLPTDVEPINKDHLENWIKNERRPLVRPPLRVNYGRVQVKGGERLSKSRVDGEFSRSIIQLYSRELLFYYLVSRDLKEDIALVTSKEIFTIYEEYDRLIRLLVKYRRAPIQSFSDEQIKKEIGWNFKEGYEVLRIITLNSAYELLPQPCFKKCVEAARDSLNFEHFAEILDTPVHWQLKHRYEAALCWNRFNPLPRPNLEERKEGFRKYLDFGTRIFLKLLVDRFRNTLIWTPQEIRNEVQVIMMRTSCNRKKFYPLLNILFYGSEKGLPIEHALMKEGKERSIELIEYALS